MHPIAAPETLSLSGVRVDRRDAGGATFRVLDIGDLLIEPSTIIGLSGPSGAGKTTLLDVVCGILRPDEGVARWGNQNISAMPENARDAWRRRHVGFVFQEFHLIPELSVIENILLPARFGAFRLAGDARDKAAAMAERIGLPNTSRRAGALSRGEQQRVAIARALAHDPPLILADEPTASLDIDNGAKVADLLIEAARHRGATMIIATHDPALRARLDRTVFMSAGRIAEPT